LTQSIKYLPIKSLKYLLLIIEESDEIIVYERYSDGNSSGSGSKVSWTKTHYNAYTTNSTYEKISLRNIEKKWHLDFTFSHVAKSLKTEQQEPFQLPTSFDEEIKKKIEFLGEDIEKRINTFDYLKKINYREATGLKISLITISGLTTIILGMKNFGFTPAQLAQLDHSKLASNIALIFSSLITALSAWEVFRDPKQLWARYTTTSSQLRGLRFELQYLKNKFVNLEDKESKEKFLEELEKIYQKYKSILEATNQDWQKIRSEEEAKHGK